MARGWGPFFCYATILNDSQLRLQSAMHNHIASIRHQLASCVHVQSTAAPEASHNDIATPEVEEDHTIDDGLTIAQRRRPRKAHTTQGHMAAITYLQAWAYSKLCAAKAVVEDDFTLPDT